MSSSPCKDIVHPRGCMSYYLEIDITAYGPFRNTYGAVLAAQHALLDTISNGHQRVNHLDLSTDRVKMFIHMHSPNLDQMSLYRDIATLLGGILKESIETGDLDLPKWDDYSITFSHHFPDPW